MGVNIYTEESLERALRSLDKLIELRTGPSVWYLAFQVDEALHLLGLDRLQADVLEDAAVVDALVDGPVNRIEELRRKVYDYLEVSG